jgi:hypothetical protein
MKHIIYSLFFLISLQVVKAQPGPIKNLRYEDDWSNLKNDSVVKKGTDKLKYIPLSKSKNSHISFDGELREWYEIRKNVNFGDVPPGYLADNNGVLLHRLMIHSDLWLGSRFRVFGQLNNTLEIGSLNEPIPEISVDGLSVHQFFYGASFGSKQRYQSILFASRTTRI